MKSLTKLTWLFGLVLTVMPTANAIAETAASTPLSEYVEGDLKLEPHPELPKVYRAITPGKDLKQFDKVMLEPIEIWVHEKSPYKGVSVDDIQALSERLVKVMQEELEPEYPVVSNAGPGVAVARIAIRGVKLEKKKRGLLGYTPIGFVATSAMDAAGKRVSLLDGTIEAEVLDGASAERVAVLVDFSFEKGDDEKDWDDIEAHLRQYAQRFRIQLDLAHGREPKSDVDVLPSVLQGD